MHRSRGGRGARDGFGDRAERGSVVIATESMNDPARWPSPTRPFSLAETASGEREAVRTGRQNSRIASFDPTAAVPCGHAHAAPSFGRIERLRNPARQLGILCCIVQLMIPRHQLNLPPPAAGGWQLPQ
jgi:hypothetical protein